MTKHTEGPWEIEWYECRADHEDVKARTAKKVGDLLWRVPKQIGPLSVGKNHWAGDHLDVSEVDAHLIAAAPKLLTTLRGAQAALRKALPYLPADTEAVFVGEWLDEVNEAIDQATGVQNDQSTD